MLTVRGKPPLEMPLPVITAFIAARRPNVANATRLGQWDDIGRYRPQCRSAPLPVQVDPRLAEQPVDVAPERPEHRPNPSPLDQPAPAGRVP
jgi:hypothetical protein